MDWLVSEFSDGEYTLQFAIQPERDHADIVREVATTDFYRRARSLLRPDSVVVDVGAHIGSFTLFAAARGARVWAFEPVPVNYTLLEENIRLNGLEAVVKPINKAVWSVSGVQTMRVTPITTGGSSLCYGSETDLEVSVQCVRLDEVMATEGIQTCDLLKLDCEGAEFDILESFDNSTWERIQAIVLEYHIFSGPNRSAERLLLLLGQHGFWTLIRSAETVGLGYILAVRSSGPGGSPSNLLTARSFQMEILHMRLAELEAKMTVREQPFASQAPIVGRLIVRVRSWWNWMSTKWYVLPLLRQQNSFNAAVTQTLRQLLASFETPARPAQGPQAKQDAVARDRSLPDSTLKN